MTSPQQDPLTALPGPYHSRISLSLTPHPSRHPFGYLLSVFPGTFDLKSFAFTILGSNSFLQVILMACSFTSFGSVLRCCLLKGLFTSLLVICLSSFTITGSIQACWIFEGCLQRCLRRNYVLWEWKIRQDFLLTGNYLILSWISMFLSLSILVSTSYHVCWHCSRH